MKILSFTTLFPNKLQPAHGIFVANRLDRLARTGEAEIRVVAPVPWFPFSGAWTGTYGRYSQVPEADQHGRLKVLHPRYPVIPKVGMTMAPLLLALSQRPVLARLIEQGYDFDLIDAHYFYPDGVAAALLGKWFNKPVVITGRGTDLNLIPQYRAPRWQIQWAARQAAGMITVCQALKNSLIDLGVASDRVSVLRNGVDLELFRPLTDNREREATRFRVGMKGTALVSVGQLIERKGNHLIIEAMKGLPEETNLYLVGDGPDRAALQALARRCGVQQRVHFVGAVPHEKLRYFYASADVMVLASSREGWANVLLEAMACGTPVAATRIWGTPEVVTTPAAGVLMKERSVEGVRDGIQTLLSQMPDRAETRRHAEQFSWDDTTIGQLRLFRRILRGAPVTAAPRYKAVNY
jgi:glycosyltransferase involved in cell wall biosynthesis